MIWHVGFIHLLFIHLLFINFMILSVWVFLMALDVLFKILEAFLAHTTVLLLIKILHFYLFFQLWHHFLLFNTSYLILILSFNRYISELIIGRNNRVNKHEWLRKEWIKGLTFSISLIKIFIQPINDRHIPNDFRSNVLENLLSLLNDIRGSIWVSIRVRSFILLCFHKFLISGSYPFWVIMLFIFMIFKKMWEANHNRPRTNYATLLTLIPTLPRIKILFFMTLNFFLLHFFFLFCFFLPFVFNLGTDTTK